MENRDNRTIAAMAAMEREDASPEPFRLQLAERIIEIHPLYPYIKEYCSGYLADSKVRGVPGEAGESGYAAAAYADVSDFKADFKADFKVDFTVAASQEDIDFERTKSAREDELEGILVRHFSDDYLETLAVYRKIAVRMLDYDTFLFHGSVLAMDGVGYLFTAQSGTGKSTHARIWREQFGERVVMVNDDKPLLRLTENGVMVYGTPWDGKHRLSTNVAVPLKAICVLSRDVTNHIAPISRYEAYPMLLQQTYRPNNAAAMARTLGLVDRLASSVELYALGCNMEPEAAWVAYEGMRQGKIADDE